MSRRTSNQFTFTNFGFYKVSVLPSKVGAQCAMGWCGVYIAWCYIILQQFCWYPFILLDGERYCGRKVSCPRTQHNDPARARTWTSRSGVQRANHKATASLTMEGNKTNKPLLAYSYVGGLCHWLKDCPQNFTVALKASRETQWPSARWTPDQEVRVRALAGSLCCVLGQDTLLSQYLSPPRSINGYRQTVRETEPDKMLGGYLRWTSIPSRRSSNTPSRFMLRKP